MNNQAAFDVYLTAGLTLIILSLIGMALVFAHAWAKSRDDRAVKQSLTAQGTSKFGPQTQDAIGGREFASMPLELSPKNYDVWVTDKPAREYSEKESTDQLTPLQEMFLAAQPMLDAVDNLPEEKKAEFRQEMYRSMGMRDFQISEMADKIAMLRPQVDIFKGKPEKIEMLWGTFSGDGWEPNKNIDLTLAQQWEENDLTIKNGTVHAHHISMEMMVMKCKEEGRKVKECSADIFRRDL